MITYGEIHREIVPDEDADLSHLDEEQLAAFGRNELWFVGVRATCTIYILLGNEEITQRITSPGLWGIGVIDTGDFYLEEVFQEQREILLAMLRELRVDGSRKSLLRSIETDA